MKTMSTIFVSGYSQSPKGTKMAEKGQIVGVMLEIDRNSNIIVDAEATFITDLAKDYFKRLAVGVNFVTEIDEFIASVDENFFIPSSNALGVAISIAYQRYKDALEKEKNK